MSVDVAGFTPIEARVRDQDFDAAEEQGEKADGGDPMRDADEGRVARGSGDGWDGRGGSCGPRGIAHWQCRIGHTECYQGRARCARRAGGGFDVRLVVIVAI